MKYQTLKDEKEFLKLAIATGINRFGDSIDALALTWLVYAITGNAMYSAFNFGINYLPTIFLTPFMGAFIEKRNKKRLMALSDFLRSLLVMLLILFYMFQQLNVYIIMFTTFMISILETLRVPSSTPMIASLVPKEKYDIAQSLHTSLSKSLEIVGMGLAGILLNSFGIMITFIIDCLSFIVSGLMIGHIHFHDNSNIQKQSTISLLKEGFHYTQTKQSLIYLCLICCCINAFLVPINAFSSALSVEVYHSGPQMVAYLSMGFSIGSVLGATLYPYISSYMNAKKMIQSLFAGASFFYIMSILISYIPITIIKSLLIVTLAILFGIIVVFANMYSQIMVLQKVHSTYLARFSAIMNSFGVSTIPLVSFFMSFMSSLFSIQNIFIFTGIFVMIIGGILLYNSIDEVIDQDEKDNI